ncbi:FAD-dependent oxidoreductase, partial [Actinomyces sp. MRS3W]|uniref:FAD-dependent oxidoreductase n=1 Tax=Actinomyces sp. MRS3W TaxID=2800796 RepID=UPI0028FD118E
MTGHLSADVVIVGAGPAGSSAAYHLATLGMDVLLLERHELGRDKVCGDGLTPAAVRELTSMGVDTSTWQRNQGLRVIGGGHQLHIPWPEQASLPSYGLARRRSELDRDLAAHAVAAGARLLTGVTATAPVT